VPNARLWISRQGIDANMQAEEPESSRAVCHQHEIECTFTVTLVTVTRS
jgi:hypothetical protein